MLSPQIIQFYKMLPLVKSNYMLISGISKLCLNPIIFNISALRSYAARKGTRERKKKQKVKAVVEKIGFVPQNIRKKEKLLLNRPRLKVIDEHLKLPTDNVYIQKYYRWKIHSFAEALECHRETHHPDIYNQPNAKLHLRIELNMVAEKKTRFMDNFTRIAPMPHPFDHGDARSIIAFTKSTEMQEQALQAGAQLCGGVELIKKIQNGSLSLQDFQYILAHPNILPELVSLRGLMKRKFPTPKNGSLDTDLSSAVKKFVNGINYSAVKDEVEKDFGLIETVIGTLDMEERHLEENYSSLINDVYQAKPRRDGVFISRCLMLSPPSREKFKVAFEQYLPKEEVKEDSDEEEESAEAII